jgi:Domain of unknown function (DUF397)
MEQLTPGWRKSSYSGNGGANCVETGNAPGAVLVRDTTNREGETLAFSAQAWRAFAAKVKTDSAN